MKNSLLLGALALISAGGCVYDPPLSGSDIYIHNQTGQYVFVSDSLPAHGNARMYDTSFINNRTQITTKANYVPRYSDYGYTLFDAHYQQIKRTQHGKMTFYFIADTNAGKPFEEINSNKLYRKLSVDVDTIKNNALNHIFYYNDTLFIEHIYEYEYRR